MLAAQSNMDRGKFTQEEVSRALSAAMKTAFSHPQPSRMTDRQRHMIHFLNMLKRLCDCATMCFISCDGVCPGWQCRAASSFVQ